MHAKVITTQFCCCWGWSAHFSVGVVWRIGKGGFGRKQGLILGECQDDFGSSL